MPYSYFFVGGLNNSYFFETVNDIIYEIKFKPSSYLFDNHINLDIADLVFEFVIGIAEKPANLKPPLDKKISVTVAH
ncbi:MAG: hypothetical protein RL060_1637, partial [Bacteroidota bacterium]